MRKIIRIKANKQILVSLFALIFFIVGCTTVKVDFSKYKSQNDSSRIPMQVALVLQPGLGKTMEMGTTLVEPINQYARRVSEQAFANVKVYTNASEVLTGADAILTPKVIKIRYTFPQSGWDEGTMQIVMEWTLKDRENKNILLMETIEGNGQHQFNPPHKFFQKVIQKAFDQLYPKTLTAFRTTQAIQKLAQ